MPKPKPKLDASVESFYKQLLNEANLSADEIDLVHTLLGNESIANVFKSGVHGRSLVDKERQQLAADKVKQEADLSKKIADLDSLRTTLTATSSTETKRIKDLQDSIAAKERDIFARDQVLKTATEKLRTYNGGAEAIADLGLDKIDFTNIPKPPTNPEPKQPTNNQINKDELLGEVQKMFATNAQALAKLPFDLLKYQQEYHSLTGKTLDPTDFYDRINKEAELNKGRVDYEQIYLRDYDIESLRKQKQEESIQARIDKEVNEKLQGELSKRLAPSMPSGQDSDFYKAVESTRPKEPETVIPSGVNDRAAVISEAVQDFIKHKAA